MKKLFVGNLSPSTSQAAVSGLFEKYGPIVSCTLVMDRMTDTSRGFAFVELESDGNAANAIQELNGELVDGSSIKVNEARPKEDRDNRGSGGYRFSSGRPSNGRPSNGGGNRKFR